MFKQSFKQQVLTGFGVSLLFVLISAITSYLSIDKLNNDTRWQTHTYDVIDLVKDVETQVMNSETGLRGFILSGDRKFLAPYTKSSVKILPTIKSLKDIIIDNPAQEARIDSLDLYAHAKIDEMQEVLLVFNTKGKEAAAQRVMLGLGQFYKNKIIAIAEQITASEKTLLKTRKNATEYSSKQSELVVVISAIIIFGLILFLFSYIKRTFDQQRETEEKIRSANLRLEHVLEENEQKNWLLSGATIVNEAMRGEQETEALTTKIIASICNYIQAPVGAIYLLDQKSNRFRFYGGYAYTKQKNAKTEYQFGEGLVGQAALEKKVKLINELPADYIKVASGLGHTNPSSILLIPVLFKDDAIAIMELGLSAKPKETTLLFLSTITESIGVGLNSAIARGKLRALYEQTQQQAEELESQQEELRTTNEELVYKSEQLMASEEELRVQQEELRETNAELEEKAQQLEERNILVNQAREAMSLKAEELEISSKYKSEFLANMSHELRTPLNSILILARILKENKPENLNEEQVKYAGVIHNAGTDLLTLINDILDLSKIESGKIDLLIEEIKPVSISKHMESLFGELARSKKIQFRTHIAPDLPASIITDQSRVEQIIKNLLSNAFKFTPENGEISLTFTKASRDTNFFTPQLSDNPGPMIAIAVKDSGIGIPEEKQKLIFEAFQQADGSTSRKYGGTGLGLSISKELAFLLGGEIQVESETGSGSCFTFFVPEKNLNNSIEVTPEATYASPPIDIKTEAVVWETKTLLIIEDDIAFAEVLRDYAIEKGFEPMLAHSGDTGLEIARSELPYAIVLDVMLPVMDGWTVLKKLKEDPKTKHIPVHMMSAGNENTSKAKHEGAIGFLTKPVERGQLDEAFDRLIDIHEEYRFNKALVIEDQELQSTVLTQQLTQRGVEVKQAFTGKEALALLKEYHFDCIILDLKLPDISGFELLDIIKSQPSLTKIPVIINTAMELDDEKMSHILKYTEAMVLKSNKSNDRLIDEVSLFMNKLRQTERSTAYKPAVKATGLSTIEKALKGKTILSTDDDMRNIFALSSALLEYELNIVIANTGKQALVKLAEIPGIDLVLMDIMMPEMDGYEAMREIRSDAKFAKLPIIALTAKAMKNDREKCIAAGANEYISKPVDIDKLLSMLRVWLS